MGHVVTRIFHEAFQALAGPSQGPPCEKVGGRAFGLHAMCGWLSPPGETQRCKHRRRTCVSECREAFPVCFASHWLGQAWVHLGGVDVHDLGLHGVWSAFAFPVEAVSIRTLFFGMPCGFSFVCLACAFNLNCDRVAQRHFPGFIFVVV